MALASTVIYEVQNGGSDTSGGGHDHVTGTRLTDLACTNGNTASPVVSSAGYTFVASDVGHYLFIRNGTNWIKGWFRIASVSAGSATLDASIGSVTLYDLTTTQMIGQNTTTGISTTATNSTGGGWAIDYTWQSTGLSLSGLSSPSSSAGTTINGNFTKAMIGNNIFIPTGVTNATSGWYTIVTVTAGTSATLDRNWNTNTVTTGWTANIGGAFASPGNVGAAMGTLQCVMFVKYSATPYSISTSSINTSNGPLNIRANSEVHGYSSRRYRGSNDITNRATLQATVSVSAGILQGQSTCQVRNLIIDGNSQTTTAGTSANTIVCQNCDFLNCTSGGHVGAGRQFRCFAKNCSSGFNNSSLVCHDCVSVSCATQGFNISFGVNTLAIGCGIGFTFGGSNIISENCTSYNSTTDAFVVNNAGIALVNCLAYTAGGKAFNANSNQATFENCAAGNITGVAYDPLAWADGNLSLSANPFANSAATINSITDAIAAFALNSTAGGGASCRAAGMVAYRDIGAIQHQDSSGTGNVSPVGTGGLVRP